jgi:hypothetical protein
MNISGGAGLLAIGNDYTGAVGIGDGFMTITDGAVVNVSGVDSNDGFVLVGQGGTGTLTVDAGGTLNVGGLLDIGSASGIGFGTVTIDDTGVINAIDTIVRSNGFLGGTGTLVTDSLTVLNGGVFDLDNVDARLLSVSGSGAILNPLEDVTLGGGRYDSVTLTNGATANIIGNLTIDAGASLTLTDVGTAVAANDLLVRGALGFGDATSATFLDVVIDGGGRVQGTGVLTAQSVLVGPGGVLAPAIRPARSRSSAT